MASTEAFQFESSMMVTWHPRQWRDCYVIAAVSGGADSVALLRALDSIKRKCEGRGSLYAVHVNHTIRGEAANADQVWLEALCEQIGVKLFVGRVDPTLIAAEQGDGWEAAARSARYDFLTKTAEQIGARFVATAHTFDDQVETVLHQFLRGTGFTGLGGIPPLRALSPSVQLVRPMLFHRREGVLRYLAELGQDFRTDASNEDTQFTRNRIRHELLPLLRAQFNSDVDRAIFRLGAQAAEVQRWIDALAEKLVDANVIVHNLGTSDLQLRINVRSMSAEPDFLVREVCKKAWRRAGWPFQSAGYEVWQQLAHLAAAAGNPPAITLPGGIRAVREADVLILTRPAGLS